MSSGPLHTAAEGDFSPYRETSWGGKSREKIEIRGNTVSGAAHPRGKNMSETPPEENTIEMYHHSGETIEK